MSSVTVARRNKTSRLALIGAAVWIGTTLVLAFSGGSMHWQGIVVTAGLNAMLALSFIVLTGFAGQFSLAQGAFMGVGAYASGLLTARADWPPILAMVVAAAGAGLVAAIIGRPIFRLKGHFLAMGTLALGVIIHTGFNNWTFAGGTSGFGGIPAFELFGFTFATLESQILLVLTALGIFIWLSMQLGRHREGRALRALRANEVAAAACGVNAAQSKTKVFVLSTIVASVSGSLYAHYMMFVNPPPFDIMVSINILVVAVIGGLRHPLGAVVGAAIFTAIKQGVDTIVPALFGQEAVGAGETFVVGGMLVLVLVLMPDGVMGKVQAAISYRKQRGREQKVTPIAISGELDFSHLAARRDKAAPTVECRGLTRTFGGVKALQDVSLEVYPGEILAVIGPNGAGKSTLVNQLSGADTPTAGEVIAEGQTVTGHASWRIARSGVGRTFQTPAIFEGMSVLENVMVGAYRTGHAGLVRSMIPTPGAVKENTLVREQAMDLLKVVGLEHLADRNGQDLSLGQQKILEIARVLIGGNHTVLLDEPAAGLNRVEKLALGQFLRQLADGGTALLLIEHDMELVMSVADRVHVLNFGQTLATGTPAEMQANQEVIDAYLGVEEPEEVIDADA